MTTTVPPAASTPSSAATCSGLVAQHDADPADAPASAPMRRADRARPASPGEPLGPRTASPGRRDPGRGHRRCAARVGGASADPRRRLGGLAVAACRQFGLARSDCPAGCRSGPGPSRPGTACPSDSQIALTVPWVAVGGLAAIVAAISCARSHSCSSATTSVTNPIRSAVWAPTRSSLPINAIRSVSPRPTRRIKPDRFEGGHQPALTWESKNVAPSAQITTSASLTKYSAPAVHMPCTAHTTGFHIFCHFGLSSSPGSSWFHTISGWP